MKEVNQFDIIEYIIKNTEIDTKEHVLEVSNAMKEVAMKRKDVKPSFLNAFAQACESLNKLTLEDMKNIKNYIVTGVDD